jgi:LEA14-like dessication related protein
MAYQKTYKVKRRRSGLSGLFGLTKTHKGLIIGGASILALFFLKGGLKLMEAAENFRVSIAGVKIHKLDLSGIKVAADLKIDNPSKQVLTVKIPSVTISYKGKTIATTSINNKTYTIPAESSSKITDVYVEASYLNLIGLVGSGIISDPAIMDNIGFEAMVEVNGVPIKVSKI